MKKKLLLLFIFLFSVESYSQYLIEPGYKVSFEVTAKTLGRTDLMPCYMAKGGFDINKNGKKELLMFCDPSQASGINDTSDVLYLLENDGIDNYKVIWTYTLPYLANSYGDIAVADVDKDGNLEIWVTFPAVVSAYRTNPPRLLCFEWDGTKIPGTPTTEWNLNLKDNFDYRPGVMVIDDLDGDGDIEIAIASRRDDYASGGGGRTLIIGSMITQIDQGGLNAFTREFLDTNAYLKGGSIYDMRSVDFDGDGKKELWVFTWDMYTLNIYEAKGTDTYSHEVEVRRSESPYDVGSFFGSQFYDVNGDGKLEYFCAGALGSPTAPVLFMSNKSDVSKIVKSDIVEIGFRKVKNSDLRGSAIGDFDKNGKMDFIAINKNDSSVIKIEYKGTGDPADSTSYTWTTFLRDTGTSKKPSRYYCTAASSDMDGDGYTEILFSNLYVKNINQPLLVIMEASKSTAVERKGSLIPEKYSLSQNYPNPFNPSTSINFSIPEKADVKIVIFDLLGQEVTTLVDEKMNAGKFSVKFNAKNLPSGIYFYTLQTNNYFEKNKMILLK